MSIYYRITEYATPSDLRWYCCDQRTAICPDCSGTVCVFCEDACEFCGESVF